MVSKRFLHSIFVVLFSFLLVCCPVGVGNNMGRGITNYPDWVSYQDTTLLCNGTSEWMDWQGEQGELLHDYVPDIAIPDDYTGKFRLHVDGQCVAIQFNDADCTLVSMIYNWIGEFYCSCCNRESNYSWAIPQADPDNYFEYDCYCKQKVTDPAVESNKAHVKLTRLRDDAGEDIGFNYLLTVNNKPLIDVDMKLPVAHSWSIKFNEKHQWLDGTLANINSKTKYCIYSNGDGIGMNSFWTLKGMDDRPGNTPIKGDDRIEKYVYYPSEGISLRYIDDATQTVQLNLLDADKSDFADYVEVVKTGDKAKLTYYKLVDGNPVVVSTYDNLGFY